MPVYSGAWDGPAVRSFLAEATIPVRLATTTPDGFLWMVSLWFRPAGADALALECATAADADLVGYLEDDPAVAFEVSTNEMPYRGVRGRGTAAVSPDDEKATLRDLLERYLGGTDGDLAERLLAPEREEVRVAIDPARVYSWDFSDRMAADASE